MSAADSPEGARKKEHSKSMIKYDLPITKNPLRTRADVQEAVRQLTEPLKPYYSKGGALLRLGNTGAVYEERTAQMEAFARPLWGLVPLAAGGGDSDLWDTYVEGIRHGTDPEHEEYWGDTGHVDQRFVEMAAIGLALCLCPDRIWGPLTEKERDNLTHWLLQINGFDLPPNNWRFFIVLANLGLKRAGGEYSQESVDAALELLDTFYLGDGWYSDGATDQRDYYVPFAMHFYGLIYAGMMEKEDPERCQVYKDRAAQFARDFIYWFAEDGSALAYGRSLTYRFAQAGFWGALAYAGVDVLDWGVVKGLLLRNLRWWFKQPIFTPDGVLSIGYAYPNLIMAEGYNAPGSPYWAFKAFLPLALGEDHPLWQAEEKPLPALAPLSVQKHARMLVSHTGNHVTALTSGQYAGFQPAHTSAKYAKFAYSNAFAFSVPKGHIGLGQGAYDSMLALSEGDDWYKVRQRCEEVNVEDKWIYSRWKPWADVTVETWLIPAGSWHIRVHRLQNGRDLTGAEGGFAIRWEDRVPQEAGGKLNTGVHDALASFHWGVSGIVDLQAARTSEIIPCEANTNLMFPRTVLPTLHGTFPKGEHWLAAAVLGVPDEGEGQALWSTPPVFREDGDGYQVLDRENGTVLWGFPTNSH